MDDLKIAIDSVQNEPTKNHIESAVIPDRRLKVLDGPTHLYRHYDADGVLLYVGISTSAAGRLKGHGRNAKWFDRIAVITVDRYPTRKKAEIAEDLAIAHEKPFYNIRRMSGAPDYDPWDPDENRVRTARTLRHIRESRDQVRSERRSRLKKEIEAAGLSSNL
jgi:hypothetical protein